MSDRLLVLAPALASGLLMAFSRTLWSYATVTEVYTLNTLLILIIFFLMLRWRRCIMADRNAHRAWPRMPAGSAPPVTTYDSLLYAAAFVFGLALGVHHVTVALMLPALAVIVYRTEGLRFFRSKRLVYAAIISIAALLAVYAYLPLAASRTAHQLGQSAFARSNMVAHHRPAVSIVLLFCPKIMAEQFVIFTRMAPSRIRLTVAAPGDCPGRRGFRQRFQAGPDDLLVSLPRGRSQSGLRVKLQHCRGQRCLLSACLCFARNCRRAWAALVDSSFSPSPCGLERADLRCRAPGAARGRRSSHRQLAFQ